MLRSLILEYHSECPTKCVYVQCVYIIETFNLNIYIYIYAENLLFFGTSQV